MLNNRLFSRVISLWNTCIEILLKSHLSVKFALTGRLSLHDLTQDGFYVSKTSICPYVNIMQYLIRFNRNCLITICIVFITTWSRFPVLDDVFRFKFCPLMPIYVINCVRLPRSSTLENEAFESKINFYVLYVTRLGKKERILTLKVFISL